MSKSPLDALLPDAPLVDAVVAAEYFLAGARDAGMVHVCISPGSRSTPLAVAAHRTEGITTSIHLDERVGAFNALGRARATGSAVGLICTSGTAGANYLPALSEASLSHVPLIAMTADRPPEHQSWGVGQTFQQNGLFHRQVRAEFSMPVGGDGGVDFSHRAGWRAGCTAIEQLGPVHVNWPFRLPLEPRMGAQNVRPKFHPSAGRSPDARPDEVQSLRTVLSNANHPVIVAGPHTLHGYLRSSRGAEPAHRLCAAAAQAGVPILADVLSGLRGPSRPALINRPFLTIERFAVDNLRCDLVVHLGHTPTAKGIRLWWEDLDADHVLIDPEDEWHDPSHRVTHRFRSTPVELLEPALGELSPTVDHLAAWTRAGERSNEVCVAAIRAKNAPREPAIAATIGEWCHDDDLLVVSSSMPVRDVDAYTAVSCPVRVHANRGINGIDGVIATAAGMSVSTVGRTVVLIGDVALLHDVGGVLDAARNGDQLTIVVANNDGGGIFSFLPARQALDDETFSRLYQTPHGATFAFLGGYPGIRYVLTDDLGPALDDAERVATNADAATVTVIEVPIAPADRADAHAALLDQVRAP